jgi:hypothetical protein
VKWFGGSFAPALSCAVFLALIPRVSVADQTLFQGDGTTLSAGLEVGAYYGHTNHANFGVGVIDFRTSAQRSSQVDAYEGYLKPHLHGHTDTDALGSFYSRLSLVAAISRGDGDAAGITRGSEEDIDSEEMVGGWRSGNLLAGLGKDALDISVGAQEFQTGDGFLIWDGNNDAFQDGAYWLIPRDAFERSAVIRLNTGPVQSALFYLKADRDHDRAEFGGINVDYILKDTLSFGAAYMDFFDADDRLTTRNGMKLADLRFKLDKIPHLPGASFSGEYVHQFGTNRGTRIEADGWHLTARYDFKSLPWTPFVRYRFAKFTGDDPSTPEFEQYDSLFYGYSEYGDWYQGEIVSNLLLANQNQRNHMVHIGAQPRAWLRLDAMYYRFDLDQRFANRTVTTNRHFADEIDLSFEIFLSRTSSIGALYSAAFPGQAAVQSVGGNKTIQAFEIFAIFTF